MERRRTFIVAATPRTGSSLLCECLGSTHIAGRPAEVFAPGFRDVWTKHLAIDRTANFAAYLRAAREYGMTSNGVYGLKIQWMHMPMLAHEASFADRSENVLEALFPGAAFVNIVRRDRRAQALSWYRAIKTNEWWRFRGDLRIRKRPPLDPATLEQLEDDIARQQASWDRYFSERGLTPLTIEYEDLAADYRAETARVLEFLGLDPTAAVSMAPPRLVVQSDEWNARWREYLEVVDS